VWGLPYLEFAICITQNISEIKDLRYYQLYPLISTVSSLFSVSFAAPAARI
jgi:hypothetical protein